MRLAEHLEAQHPFVVANMARVDLDHQVIEAHDAMGKDVGHMEQRGEYAL